MNIIEKNILEIAKEVIEKNNCSLIDSVFRGEKGSKVIEFYIDSEKDVTADMCAEISREISSQIDEKITEISKFRLEVSSPGVDRPLKYLFQYHKHVNRKFEIEFNSDEGIKQIKGKLLKVEESGDMIFSMNKEEMKINFNNINKAKVLISFS